MSEHDANEALSRNVLDLTALDEDRVQSEGASDFSWQLSDLVIAVIAVVICTLWGTGVIG